MTDTDKYEGLIDAEGYIDYDGIIILLSEVKRLRGLLQAVLDNVDEADLDNEVYLDSEIVNRITTYLKTKVE